MGYFDNIQFEITQDGSIGLFDKKIGDIFHSKTGALKEAIDKFINPIMPVLSNFPDTISVLDIGFGIGYNSKAILNTLPNYNIKIDALEYDESLIFLSPFINDEINNDDLKFFLLYQICNSIDDDNRLNDVLNLLAQNQFDKYISPFTMRFIAGLKTEGYIFNSSSENDALLHNIYYSYISNRIKNDLKSNKYTNSSISFFLGDARKTIFNTNSVYDVVFLDAFSPQKDPTLWTIDFLSVVKSKMKQNSVILSFSKSTPFRSALLELGFCVGKTFIDGSDMGTTASLNPSLIYNKLNKNDIDIIQTRSGIPYRDINLNLPPSSIFINRSIEGAASNRISRTKFDKII